MTTVKSIIVAVFIVFAAAMFAIGIVALGQATAYQHRFGPGDFVEAVIDGRRGQVLSTGHDDRIRVRFNSAENTRIVSDRELRPAK